MRTSIPLFSAVLFLAACGQKESNTSGSTNTTTAESSPLSAPAGYLGALGKGKQLAEKTVDTASLNSAIQMFNVQEGRYPENLDELVTLKYLPHLPDPPYGMKFSYDPKAGAVKVVKK